jgi:hypothetical protein
MTVFDICIYLERRMKYVLYGANELFSRARGQELYALL